MIKKLFLLMLVGLIGGCASVARHPTNIKKSFVKINKTVEINVCGQIGETKTNECKELMSLNSSGSGAIVWNERVIGKTPRTLILTADHICADEEYKLTDFDPAIHLHVKNNLGFIGPVDVVAKSKMSVTDSFGQEFKVKQFPWVRNVSADTCIIETSMNAPSLQVGSKPQYGEKVINIAAPKGIYHPSSSGGGVYYTEGLYNGEFLAQHGDGARVFSMYNLIAAPGSSGSPVLNQNGEIIGMIHSIDSRYCNLITSQCNSPVSYSATLEQVKATLLEALAAIKRGEVIIFDYKRVNQ
jgi:S1-C subfamily serine protease